MSEMVDVGEKPLVRRRATASGVLRLKPTTVAAIREGKIPKGDVREAASVAALQAAKRTSEIIPHCHPLRIDAARPTIELGADGVTVRCEVRAEERTGVEMEALTGVTVALLTIWDMVKSLEKDADGQYPTARIEAVRVEEKVKG